MHLHVRQSLSPFTPLLGASTPAPDSLSACATLIRSVSWTWRLDSTISSVVAGQASNGTCHVKQCEARLLCGGVWLRCRHARSATVAI